MIFFLFQEARRDLQYGASPTHEWSLELFTTQFNELVSWLNSIEDAMYNKTESVIDRKLRLVNIILFMIYYLF